MRSREPHCVTAAAPKAALLRELKTTRTPPYRSHPCLCGLPALAHGTIWSQCVYSNDASPTPPAPACSKHACLAAVLLMLNAVCDVLHTVGREHACSGDIKLAFRDNRRASARASVARGAVAIPNAMTPYGNATAQLELRAVITPAQSPPRGPGSPGYSPSRLSTSRKLSPAACTRSSTSKGANNGPKGGCGPICRLLTAPRDAKDACTATHSDGRARQSRSACRVRPRTASSDSTKPVCSRPISSRSQPAEPPMSMQESCAEGASCLEARTSPHAPA